MFIIAVLLINFIVCEWTQNLKNSRLNSLSSATPSNKEWEYEVSGFIDGYFIIDESSSNLVFIETKNKQVVGLDLNNGSVSFSSKIETEDSLGGGLIPESPNDNLYFFYVEIVKDHVLGIYDNITIFDLKEKKQTKFMQEAIMIDKVDFVLYGNNVIASNRIDYANGNYDMSLVSTNFETGKMNWKIDDICCVTNDCRVTVSDNVLYLMEDNIDPGSEITGVKSQTMYMINADTGDKNRILFNFISDGSSKRIAVDSENKIFFFAQRLKQDLKFHMYGMNTTSGEMVWETVLDDVDMNMECSNAVIGDNQVYIVCGFYKNKENRNDKNSYYYGFDKKTGEILSSIELDFDNCYQVVSGKKGNNFVSCHHYESGTDFDARVYKIRQNDGKILNTVDTQGFFSVSPIVDSSDNLYYCIFLKSKSTCYKKNIE